MTHQINTTFLTLLTLVGLFSSAIVSAHAEKDKSRYVSPTGIDSGLCDNPLRPCKTLLYGLSRASKGDKVLLSSGEYNIETLEEILAFKNTLIPVLGGYNRFDHFSNQSPSTNQTKLTGIPHDMVDNVRQKGFSVIADGKEKLSKQRINTANKQYLAASKSHATAACVDGYAAGFACNNVDLVAHVALNDFSTRPNSGNDIWGHVDLNTHKEYAIVAIAKGVVIFDLSNPESPKEVGTTSGLSSTWRDIKVYQYYDKALKVWQAYAYVTIDKRDDFVSIIDLNQLPNSVSLVAKDRAVSQAHNVYISNVDYSLNIPLNEATPTLQLVGAPRTSTYNQSFLSYSLEDPRKLAALPAGDNLKNGYTHDGTSIRIDDERKNTDCENNGKTCEIFIDFNETEIKIWNVTIPGQEKQLSNITYSDVLTSQQYVHSGWWSEDKRYIFSHDESDESRAGLNTTLRIFDLQSLTSPTLAGIWTGTTPAIDHNGYVRGNRYFMSNYTRGMTILDISDASAPKEVGFFDTYSASNTSTYNGAWGIYPFLPSGLLLVNDISGGLFVLRDNTRTVVQGSVSFSQASLDAKPGQTITLDISRENGNQGAVTVGYETLPGGATPVNDYIDIKGTITWNDGESDHKSISIDVAENVDINEIQEQFFVRLFNPTNGATLSVPHYVTVKIEGKPNPGTVGFEHQTININEPVGSISLKVFRNGGTDGAVAVDYSIFSESATVGEDFLQSSNTLDWADGNNDVKIVEIMITDDALSEEDESFRITLTPIDNTTLSTNNDLTITIKDDEKNTPPAVTIIEDFEVNANQTTQLTSTALDVENDAITYLWVQTVGDTVDLVNSNTKDASFVSPNQAASLTFKLAVTDSRGATAEQLVTVSVKVPVVDADKKSSSGSLPYGLVLSLMLLIRVRKSVNMK